MKGLEASILSINEARDLNPGLRVDAEYFNREALGALAGIRHGQHERLGDLCARIQHPVEVKREYEDAGLLTVMAKNVRSNRIEMADPRFMPSDLRPTVLQNLLESGDVLVTRTGANFGQSAPWRQGYEAYACADILILRSPKLATGFLSSFLECAKGKPLVLRGGYGAGQPHIAPPYLRDLPVPRFAELEYKVDQTVTRSVELEDKAVLQIQDAERALLTAIDLANWTPLEPLTYTARAKDAVAARRLDARFYAPHIRALLDILSKNKRTIGEVAQQRREKFLPDACVNFDYIEISDIDGAGAATSTRLACSEAPSRATWHVRPDDIITSTVRPIRRLSAQIAPEQDGFVCSSGFVVVEPQAIASEVLLTFLRLPVICELLDLFASASMYPAITENDIFNLPLPHIPDAVAAEVTRSVRDAKAAKVRAAAMLDAAKRAVEIAIEDSEAAAMAYLTQAEEAI